MSLANYEASRYSGTPVNLYLFTYGPNSEDFFAYTDAEGFVTFGVDADGHPINYLPLPIDRGKITSSGTLDKANMTITTPHDSDLANLYLIYPPSYVTTLIMYQGHVDDPDNEFKVVWSGRVMSCARKGSSAEFTCQPVSTALRRNGCRRRYQYGCPLVLYGEDCGASKSDATYATTVEAMTGTRITVPSGWSGAARSAKFLQGIAEWTSPGGTYEVRTILRVENGGQTFLLSGTTRGLSVGAAVNMVLGCNHKSGTSAQPDGDCGPLHNNVQNFGGQERIPFTNPIGLTNAYY